MTLLAGWVLLGTARGRADDCTDLLILSLAPVRPRTHPALASGADAWVAEAGAPKSGLRNAVGDPLEQQARLPSMVFCVKGPEAHPHLGSLIGQLLDSDDDIVDLDLPLGRSGLCPLLYRVSAARSRTSLRRSPCASVYRGPPATS